MMRHTALLKADAAINLILGILLMAFPAKLVRGKTEFARARPNLSLGTGADSERTQSV